MCCRFFLLLPHNYVNGMAVLRKIGKFFLLVSIPAMLLLFYNQAAYWHYHILGDGTVVKHAHPYNSESKGTTPYQNHQHSDFELLALAQLSEVLTLLWMGLFIMGLSKAKSTGIFRRPDAVFVPSPFLSIVSLRAPPLVYS